MPCTPWRFTVPIAVRQIFPRTCSAKSHGSKAIHARNRARRRTGRSFPFDSWAIHADVMTAVPGHEEDGLPAPVWRDSFECAVEPPARGSGRPCISRHWTYPKRYARIGIDPFAILSDEALENMALDFDKRLVVGHNPGIADECCVTLVPFDQPGCGCQTGTPILAGRGIIWPRRGLPVMIGPEKVSSTRQ